MAKNEVKLMTGGDLRGLISYVMRNRPESPTLGGGRTFCEAQRCRIHEETDVSSPSLEVAEDASSACAKEFYESAAVSPPGRHLCDLTLRILRWRCPLDEIEPLVCLTVLRKWSDIRGK